MPTPRPVAARASADGLAMALAAVAHRKLDSEVHPQADKQGDKGDGDDVENADHGQTRAHGDGKPTNKVTRMAK
jgi:hypothetical protein